MNNEIMRDEFEQWVMTKIFISKSTLIGLRVNGGYRNTTLSGRDYNLMWETWVASRSVLKPVGFTSEDELNYREKEETNGLFFSTVDNECCHIPLYRLDK